MNAFIYMLRREIWEHRAFVMVPMVIAALYLVGHLLGLFQVARVMSFDGHNFYEFADFVEEMAWKDPEERRAILGFMMGMYAMPFFITLAFMTFFYLLDSLFSDRKDRSILFWKSLPITDTATVMSKWVTAAVVAPLITIGWVFAMHMSTLIVLTLLAWFGGGSAWDLVWSPMPFFDVYLFYIYVMFTAALWFAPVWGWLILASAWARRAVFLWATLPIVAIGVMEGIFSHTNYFWQVIGYRVSWGYGITSFRSDFDPGVNFRNDMVDVSGSITDLINFSGFMTNPDMYLGVLVGGVFTAAAIWLRRYRDET
jgi:ABC-2 type transport system permease protein